jgi:hypothetical protein
MHPYIYIWMHTSFEFLYLCLAKKNNIPNLHSKECFLLQRTMNGVVEGWRKRAFTQIRGPATARVKEEPREKTIEDKGCDVYVHTLLGKSRVSFYI